MRLEEMIKQAHNDFKKESTPFNANTLINLDRFKRVADAHIKHGHESNFPHQLQMEHDNLYGHVSKYNNAPVITASDGHPAYKEYYDRKKKEISKK